MGLEIQSVAFDPEGGLQIAYMDVPEDIRVAGAVVMQHSIRLDGRHPDYGDDIEGLQRKIVKILKNGLEDFHSSAAYDPSLEDDDEDDERGMGE